VPSIYYIHKVMAVRCEGWVQKYMLDSARS